MGSSIGGFLGQSGQAQAAGLTGAGQAAAGGITGAAGAGAQGVFGAGQGAAGGILGAAQARASGYLGSANALTGGLNTGLNFYQSQQLLNATCAAYNFAILIYCLRKRHERLKPNDRARRAPITA
jgi:hypothetical protein